MHFPGHLREAFCDWLEEGCPPLARVEIRYQAETWPAERLLRKMLNCSDIVPGDFSREVVERFGLELSRKQTYGSLARLLLDRVNSAQAVGS
jgi:hypothetical protein